jgi:hypothetical protein
MEELLLIIIAFAFGWFAREWLAMYQMSQILSRMEVHTQEHFEEEMENMIPINIEYHDDKFYVYQQDGGVFMAQGKTRRELEENLMKRYPGKKFAANTNNLREVGFK